MTQMLPDRFQILSLDGGGIKGLFAAAVLARLEDDLGIRVADHFDLITGTSTGGIIALGLGAGLSPREIVQFYVHRGPEIFANRFGWRTLCRWWKRKFSPEPLQVALRECFQDRRLGDSQKRLVIPSFSLDRDDIYLFKTPHHPRLNRDWREPMWKVALATSAAPTYFPTCCEIDRIRLVDGGVWANNPAMVGVVEAKSMLNIPLESIWVWSVGTTTPTIERPQSLNGGGLWQWRSAGVDVALRGQSRGVQAQVQHLLGADRAKRLDAVVADGVFELDRLSEDRLLSEAAHASRLFSPEFNQIYRSHTAPAFRPLQPQNSTSRANTVVAT
jgi:patatin-like phospholipase/acyl hydrolase